VKSLQRIYERIALSFSAYFSSAIFLLRTSGESFIGSLPNLDQCNHSVVNKQRATTYPQRHQSINVKRLDFARFFIERWLPLEVWQWRWITAPRKSVIKPNASKLNT
jgi:hypothetical protein